MKFEDAFALLLKHEGGYVNNADDPGGATKFGICKRDYPNEDLSCLTIERAQEIYRRDYWIPVGCERHDLPEDLKFDLFDMAVNSGQDAAIRTLQTAVNAIPIDGKLGPLTIERINAIPTWRIRATFNALRLIYMVNRRNWPDASRGWARRVANNLLRI
jgi:lysozyme family protein